MKRILVIRGGAIGDFVLTLPAIKLLRDRFPHAHLEILGYKHIAALAEKRLYADAVRSIESASLSKFFAKGSQLPAELLGYFSGFDLVLSYLYDPDKIFESNIGRSGVRVFLTGPAKLDQSEHAAFQLARPLATLGLSLTDPAAQLFPSESDRHSVSALRGECGRLIAFHPGSGSEMKNWPIKNWIELGNAVLANGRALAIISGEADLERSDRLKAEWRGKPVVFAEHRELPSVAALLEGSVLVGHDSGISHIAGAVGARCLLLFGLTDPSIWAPANKNVTVLRAPEGKLQGLKTDPVATALWAAMGSS